MTTKSAFVSFFLLIFMLQAESLFAGAVLKIATISPDGSDWMIRFRKAGKEVAEKTANRVRFKFYPGGVMGDDKAVLRKIRIGQLHGGAVTSGSLARYYTDNQVYNIPMKFESFDEIDYIRERMDPIIIQGLENGGFATFGLAEGGFAYLMSDSPIINIDDLRKQKIWIPENDDMSLATVKAFGVTPIPLSIAEVRAALQTGIVNTVAVSPIGAIALQWHTQIRYLTNTPLIYIYAVLAVSQKAFRKISIDDQKIVRDVMGQMFREIDAQNRKDNIKALKALRDQGIRFVMPKTQALDEWRNLASTVSTRMVKSGSLTKDIVQMLENYLLEFRSKKQAAYD